MSTEAEGPLSPVDSRFLEFVAAVETGDPAARSLPPWLKSLAQEDKSEFLQRVALYLSLENTVPERQREPMPGRSIGRYRLDRVIARREHSIVYAALDMELDRVVAVKVLPGQAQLRSGLRMRREALVLARLRHPSLTPVYDAGETGDDCYLVLEFVDGPDLSGIQIGSTADEVRMATEVCEALIYLHAHGIVHRDIKPSNILLRPDRSVALTDFGLVRETEAESSLTGPMLGTPMFMAPELAVDPASADSAADLYSLAVTLVHRLTGCSPFTGMPVPQIYAALLEGRAPFSRSDWQRVPTALRPTLNACLDPNPINRPSADALARDLRAWSGGRTLVLGERSPTERSRRWIIDRRRWIARCVAGAAGCGVAIWWWRGGLSIPTAAQVVPFLFDPGDLVSVEDKIHGFGEGVSPIASSLLESRRTEWSRRRLSKAQELVASLPTDEPRDQDESLVRACVSVLTDPTVSIASMLGPHQDSVAGQALESERLRIVGDVSAAARVWKKAGLQRPESGGDRFFQTLTRLSRAERGSNQQIVMADPEQTGVWTGWSHLLVAANSRRTGDAADPMHINRAAEAIPESFLVEYFRRVVQPNSTSLLNTIANCAFLTETFGSTDAVHDVLLSNGSTVSPAVSKLAWAAIQTNPSGSRFGAHDALLQGLFGHGQFDEIEALEFLRGRIDAERVWIYFRTAELAGCLRAKTSITPRRPRRWSGAFETLDRLLQRAGRLTGVGHPISMGETDSSNFVPHFLSSLARPEDTVLLELADERSYQIPLHLAARSGVLAACIASLLRTREDCGLVLDVVGHAHLLLKSQTRRSPPRNVAESAILPLLHASLDLGSFRIRPDQRGILEALHRQLNLPDPGNLESEQAVENLGKALSLLETYQPESTLDGVSLAGCLVMAAYLRARLAPGIGTKLPNWSSLLDQAEAASPILGNRVGLAGIRNWFFPG